MIVTYLEETVLLGATEVVEVPIYEDVEVSVVFFFQAEDGIRDLTVTGVQTCALPIFLFHDDPRRDLANRPLVGEPGAVQEAVLIVGKIVTGVGFVVYQIHPAVHDTDRSEERRVGKECRSRWSPYH